jgi:hypothetical protein
MQATDQQMQVYSDTYMRVFAEIGRSLELGLADAEDAITDVYDRAANGPPWTDSRVDVPHKSTSQDVLVFNSVCTLMAKCFNGTATVADVQNLSTNWVIFQQLCIQPVR